MASYMLSPGGCLTSGLDVMPVYGIIDAQVGNPEPAIDDLHVRNAVRLGC